MLTPPLWSRALSAARSSLTILAVAAAFLHPLSLASGRSDGRPASDPQAASGSITLDGTWQMKDYAEGIGVSRQVMAPGNTPKGCIPIRVPGTVRTALLEAGEIPDPYFGYDNEKSLWVESKEWWFFRTFPLGVEAKGKRIDLVFEGASFQGEAYLNGARVGDLKGMLNPRSFDVSTVLNYGGENTIAVRLEATPDARINEIARGLTWDAPRAQLYSIAQCMYGWDWGPHGVPVGLWKPVWLRVSGPVHVDHPYIRTKIKSPAEAVCSIELELENLTDQPKDVSVRGTVSEKASGQGVDEFKENFKLRSREIKRIGVETKVRNPKLWWPNGMGAQDLYTLNATVEADGQVSETAKTTFGIRELKLVENENVAEYIRSLKSEAGNQYTLGKVVGSYPWTFQVNGRKMFAKGGNWIPVDQLLRLDRDRYDRLLALARDAHFNLLRVWGGGLYETDDFYELCDRYGLLAWQEFLSNRSFSKIDRPSFLEGAESAVYRLRNHPSLTFWCGGNEFDPDDAGSKAVVDDLASMLAKLDPGREFHRASPYKGDDHHWGVWHGQQPYTAYRIVRPFRSEAGMNTFPVPEDYVKFTPKSLLWPLDTTYIEYHGEYNTRFQHLQKLMRYADEFGPSSSIDNCIMKSELYQALANSFNMEYCRSHKFQNSGLLIWQFNDIWPCVSWAMVDWYGTPKPSYYFQKRASRPVHIAADYERYVWKVGETFASDVYLLNDTDSPVSDASYVVKLLDDASRVLATGAGPAATGPNASSKVGHIDFRIPDAMAGKMFFVSVELMGKDGRKVSDALYPIAVSRDGRLDEYNNVFADMNPLPESAVKVKPGSVHESSSGRALAVAISNPTERVAYFVRLRLLEESATVRSSFSDNYISLLPGETKTIDARIETGGASPAGGKLTFEVTGWNCPAATATVGE